MRLVVLLICLPLLGACAGMMMGNASTPQSSIGADSRSDAQISADSALEQSILRSFTSDALLNGSDIAVKARSGAVTLSGTVNSFPKRDQAVALARATTGALSVRNQVSVKRGS